jgi:hypothetical protein
VSTPKAASEFIEPYEIDPAANKMPPYINPDEVLASVVGLFVREPSLPNKLLNLASGHEPTDKVGSIFHHLFIGTTRSALGTNDRIVGYRLRDMNERHPMLRAENVNFADDGHLPSSDMIAAGVDILVARYDAVGSSVDRAAIVEIFEAMLAKKAFVRVVPRS